MFSILIDADGCPVVEESVDLAQVYDIPVTIVCDTSHIIHEPYAKLIMADKGKDQSDFLLLKHVHKGDIVVTQDYGLAALVLAKEAMAISQNGLIYTKDNMETLLQSRHEHAKQRQHKHYGHIPKRTRADDEAFMEALEELVYQKLETVKKP